jgi:hypothetical protein
VEVTKDIKVKRKSGKKTYTNYHRLAYIKVDEVLKNDLADFTVKPGDKVEVKIGPTARRAKKLAKKSIGGSSRSNEKGDSGIWLLTSYGKGFTIYFHFNLLDIERLDELKTIVSDLATEYKAALKDEIPMYAAIRKKLLSRPAFSQAEADALMGSGIPPKIDLSQVYAANYGRLQTVFIANTGRVLGGVPYYPTRQVFAEGLLPVSTFVNGVYSRYNFVDRNGKLLCDKFYTNAAAFSEGRALVVSEKRCGYIDTEGKEVIPCIYKNARDFSDGKAIVVKEGKKYNEMHIDTMGKRVWPDPTEIVYHDGLSKIRFYDKEKKVRLWGFADKQGKTVIPPRFRVVRDFSDGMAAFCNDQERQWGFIDKSGSEVFPATAFSVSDFSDGMAAVETSVWIDRHGYYGNPAIKFSENAPQHFLSYRWGFINKKGEMVIPPLFDSVWSFQNGLAQVTIHMRSKSNRSFVGLIDKAGNVVFVKSNPALEEH